MGMISFRSKRRCRVQVVTFYIALVLVFASTTVVIWNFRDECYQFHMPPSEKHLKKCRQPGPKNDVIYFEVTQEPFVIKQVQSSSPLKENFEHRDLRAAVGLIPWKSVPKSDEKKSSLYYRELNDAKYTTSDKVEHFKVIQSNVTNYFKERRTDTQNSCLKMFYDEEGVNFDAPDGDAFLGELTKLEKLERGVKNKFFVQTSPLKRTRWIFYKNQDEFNNVEIQWCPLYKSASTPWMAIFTKLAKALTEITEAKIRSGKITFVNLAKDFRLYIPRVEVHSTTGNAPRYSMVVVRHPFKRILSAYQDKIERVKGREYYRNFRKAILRTFRSPAALERITIPGKGGVVVPAWYRMALDLQNRYEMVNSRAVSTNTSPQSTQTETANSKSGSETTKSTLHLKQILKLEPVPTFSEFCRYLLTLDPKSMDEHWRPQYLDCSPCHHKFDLILKVETLEQDKEAIFQLLGYEKYSYNENHALNELEQVWKRWANPSKHNHNESYYFSQLSEEVVQNLHNLYEPDFQLYGYSPDEYFDIAKGNK